MSDLNGYIGSQEVENAIRKFEKGTINAEKENALLLHTEQPFHHEHILFTQRLTQVHILQIQQYSSNI